MSQAILLCERAQADKVNGVDLKKRLRSLGMPQLVTSNFRITDEGAVLGRTDKMLPGTYTPE